MPFKTKRNGYMKVLAHGRQGRAIYDELVDVLPRPTMFEQAHPFEWEAGPDAEVPEQPPSLVDDDEFVALATPEPEDVVPDEPPTDEELVEFWAGMVRDKPKPKRDGKSGRFVKADG